MTPRERRRIAMRHAFMYQAYKREVQEYRAQALAMRGQRINAVPGSTSAGSHTDPTQQAGIKLADMPEKLKQKAAWVKTVNDAWADCATEDDGDPHGLAFLLERNFRLTGEATGKDKNAAVREEIMREAHISMATFYNRLENVADILVYHATRRRLL